MKQNHLKKIRKENTVYEKALPYNYCDRWCERCSPERQVRCRLYMDELDVKLSNIAYGRAEDDSEFWKEKRDVLIVVAESATLV